MYQADTHHVVSGGGGGVGWGRGDEKVGGVSEVNGNMSKEMFQMGHNRPAVKRQLFPHLDGMPSLALSHLMSPLPLFVISRTSNPQFFSLTLVHGLRLPS